jgi:hypothetical protein
MAWANFLLLGNVVMVWRMRRIFAGEFGHLLRDMALVYAVPLALFGAAAWLAPPGAPRLGTTALAGLASGGVLFWRFRPLLRRFLDERSHAQGAA